jgi:flavin-dependent dehydrogenase
MRQPAAMSAALRPDILIAGGGLAGAAAALGLVRTGLAVTLIERENKPVHKICGEFISFEAQDYLSRLGLDVAALGGAAISRLRLIRGAETISTELPFAAIGLSRFKLDEALLRHAQDLGVQVLRGRSVRKVSVENKIAVDIEDIGIVEPDVMMLATGKHELRGIKRQLNAQTKQKNLIGFKMYFKLRPAARASLEHHIELIFFPGGYAGLQLIEDGVANLCLLVDRDCYRQCGGNWPSLLQHLQTSTPVLAHRLAGAEPMLQQPLTIYQVPYGFIHQPHDTDPPGLFRLGDQACVIQSFTGDGMSIALHSSALAVQAVVNKQDSNSFHRRLAHDVRGQIKRADIIYALMNHRLTQTAALKISSLWPQSLKIAAQLTRVAINHN